MRERSPLVAEDMKEKALYKAIKFLLSKKGKRMIIERLNVFLTR